MRNPLRIHNSIQPLILSQALVVPPRCQHITATSVSLQKPVIPQVGQVIHRLVEIDILIIVTVQKIPQVERGAHRQESSKDIGMLERYIHRMESSKAATQADQVRVL